MKIRRRKHAATVPSTAMGDIAFNLLIFFVILARAQDDSHLNWEPAAAEELDSAGGAKISVVIDSDNKYYINGKPYGEVELAPELKVLLADAPEGQRTVLLKVHREAQAMYFEPAIEAISEAGGDLVHILEEKPRGIALMDVRQDDSNGQSANVAQVEAFLSSLGHRTPQEAIGMRNEGGLRDGLIVGLIGVLFVTAVGTVVPFFLAKQEGATASVNSQPKNKPAEKPETAPQPAQEKPSGDAKAAEGANTAPVANPDRVLDSLGIGEAKQAAPDVNPREKELNDLLDGVK